ncbi:acyl-CoA dehydrogenase family protein [Nocardioides insulae]|uniref:acyl-CoA dehydrogenase family protein n=1 Tax=Nocardioides insulae TaxID=394734 RepID=UPI0003FE5EC0|nr:acyl-CoA dehydrogenase family protein [Nocardioides insulae]
MSLLFNDEQDALHDAVRRFVEQHSPMTKVREVIGSDASFDPTVWRRLTDDLGLAGLAIPVEYGGAGATLADVSAAYRPLGAGLVPSPLLASAVLAAGLLLALDDEAAKKEWLPQLAAGELIGSVAISEPGNRSWVPAELSTRAVATAEGSRLTGTKVAVLNGADADVLLVIASGDQGAGVHLVRRDAEGLTVTATKGVDLVRGVATVTMQDTPATPLSGDGLAALDKTLDLVNVVVASEQVGAMERLLELTATYAKERYSFGQPIGAYQGVKHPVANMFTSLSLVDASLRETVEEGQDDVRAAAAATRVLANQAYVVASRDTMLMHGGIGFTWEHDAHLYAKNAMADNVLFGTTEEQLDRLAATVLD